MKTQKATAPIPTKRQISPDFAKLTDRLTALYGERGTLDVERGELARTHTNELSSRNTARDARASEIIDGQPVSEIPTDAARLAAITRRIGDLDRAIEILKGQIDEEGRRAGAFIVEIITAPHAKLVANLSAALIAAHDANKSYHRLVDALNADNVNWTGLGPMQPNAVLGQPNDRYSVVAIFLRQAVVGGFISAETVPVELRA